MRGCDRRGVWMLNRRRGWRVTPDGWRCCSGDNKVVFMLVVVRLIGTGDVERGGLCGGWITG